MNLMPYVFITNRIKLIYWQQDACI